MYRVLEGVDIVLQAPLDILWETCTFQVLFFSAFSPFLYQRLELCCNYYISIPTLKKFFKDNKKKYVKKLNWEMVASVSYFVNPKIIFFTSMNFQILLVFQIKNKFLNTLCTNGMLITYVLQFCCDIFVIYSHFAIH